MFMSDADFDLAHDRAAEPDRKRTCPNCFKWPADAKPGKLYPKVPIELEQARNCEHWYCPECTDELHQQAGVCASRDCFRAELNRLIMRKARR